MSSITPKTLSFRLALALSIVCSFIASLAWLYYFDFNLLFTSLILISTFIISYLMLLWGLTQFIDKKFRLIYKTIHSLKIGLKKEPQRIDIKEDLFGKIRKEVIEWKMIR